MGYLVLRADALFCAAASVGKLLFIRPSTSKPKPSVINTSARVMFRGCASSSIVRGFFMVPPGSPSHLGREPINLEWSAHARFGARSADIQSCRSDVSVEPEAA